MSVVTVIEEKLIKLQEATDRYDRTEVERKDAREHLAAQAREAWKSGASIDQLREITGFSRGHVYDLLGDITRSHSEIRRERRTRISAHPEES